MSSLEVNLRQLDAKFPKFTEPKQVGGFSLDGKRKFHNDERCLRYVCLPRNLKKVDFDLNEGYETAVRKSHTLDEKLDTLLEWIMSNKSSLKRYIKEDGKIADFVCYRGTLTLIMCTPYERQEGWIICAKKMNGTIYLCQFDTPEKIEREETMNERSKLMSYWGYKFEQYVTADSPEDAPDTTKIVNELEEYCCVVRGHLGSFSLIFGAEMDGVNCKERTPGTTRGFYEMKTNRHLQTTRQENHFKKFKLLKWWAQSFLIGIRNIICGFRDDDGFVHKLKIFPVANIPSMAEDMWKGNVCMNFGNAFLQHVVKCFERYDDRTLLKFSCNAENKKVECIPLKSTPEYEFLPPWFSYDLAAT